MLQRMAALLALVTILSAGLPAARADDALYGPVRPGESFWAIADRLRDKPRVSQEQEMLALYLYNTEAFVGGLDGLQKGSTLRVPTAEQALEISQQDAGRYIANLHRYKGVPPSMRHLVRKAGTAAPVASATEDAVGTQAEPAPPAAVPSALQTAANTPSGSTVVDTTPAQSEEKRSPAQTPAAVPAAEDASAAEALPQAEEAGRQATAEPAVAPASIGPAIVEAAAPQPEPKAAEGTDILGVHVPLPADQLVMAGFGAVFLLLVLAQIVRVLRSPREDAKPAAVPPPRRAPVEPLIAPVVAAKPDPVEEPAPEPVREPEPVFVAPEPEAAAPVIEAPEPLPEEPPALNDPIADADFQLGYGHFDEAIAGLEEALLVTPMSRDVIMKLAETYAEAGRAADFEQLVARYNGTFGDSDWMRVQSLGRQLRPESQLFGGWVPVPPAPAGWLQPVPDDALDLSTPAVESGQAIPADQLPPEFGDFDLESLEAEDGPFTTDDVGTKLDLARAYLDMDDQEMARSLLDEVIEQGGEAQKREAQALRDQLPPHSPPQGA